MQNGVDWKNKKITGFSISFILFYLTNLAFPVPVGMGEIDDADVYGTFTTAEADALGVISADLVHGVDPVLEKEGVQNVTVTESDAPKMLKLKEWFRG
jgi:hypothetical protein